MTKEKQVSLKMNVQTAFEVLQLLDSSVDGYSVEFAPERIVRLRQVMQELDKELEKVLM